MRNLVSHHGSAVANSLEVQSLNAAKAVNAWATNTIPNVFSKIHRQKVRPNVKDYTTSAAGKPSQVRPHAVKAPSVSLHQNGIRNAY
jgi:hypothetical protein